jgi:hypothetical protein
MDQIIAASAGQLTIATDGWTNQRSESIINYVAQTRQQSIFLKTEVTGSERHTGSMIADRLKATIEEVGGEEAVIAVVTDNASNMKAAWPELEERYPRLLTIGCASHIVNLTVEQILRIPCISNLINIAVDTVKYFKNSTILTGALNEAATAAHKHRLALQLPGKTRWQGKLDTINSLVANKPFIHTVLGDEKVCLSARPTPKNRAKYEFFKEKLHRYEFWEQLDTLQLFLKPFLEVTIALESNKPKASRIYGYFRHLLKKTAYTTSLPRDQIYAIIGERWAQVQRPQFTVAYICDPAARGEREVDISEEQWLEVATWLDQRYRELGKASLLYKELLDVWNRSGSYSNKVVWESFHIYPDPADWWRQRACSDDLKALAIYSLSINPTTGAAERNWSVHGYLHSKARNRLTNQRVQKLVYLFQNLRVRD